MPPVLLAALVVTSTFADGRHLQVDASTAGVAVAGVLIWRRHSIVLAVVVAAAVTARSGRSADPGVRGSRWTTRP